jgi:PQQ-like domain
LKGSAAWRHSAAEVLNMKHRFVLSSAVAAVAALSYFAASTWSQPRIRQVAAIRPVPFQSSDGAITGWKITIPGGKPLATPAVVDGRVFVGGGFGSHEFYALDATSGNPLWNYHTADDGPTAAVVDGPTIIFNTESCELETITRDGKPLWKKWLGDPLMSMPAVADGTVYMAYPNSRGDHRYYLAAFDLQTGKELWKQPIASEIITAPVIEDKRVYVATLDGSLFSFDRQDGAQVIHEARNATSAPAVWNGQVYFSRREQSMVAMNGRSVAQQNEVFAARPIAPAAPVKDMERTKQQADYLDYSKRKGFTRRVGEPGHGSVGRIWRLEGKCERADDARQPRPGERTRSLGVPRIEVVCRPGAAVQFDGRQGYQCGPEDREGGLEPDAAR